MASSWSSWSLSAARRARTAGSSRRAGAWTTGSSAAGSAICGPEHRRVHLLQGLAVAEVHVDATRQARVEAAHRAHDVNALEVVRAVLLEDGRVLDGVLVGAGRAEAVAGAAVPRRRRIRVVVGDQPILDHHVVRERPPHGL